MNLQAGQKSNATESWKEIQGREMSLVSAILGFVSQVSQLFSEPSPRSAGSLLSRLDQALHNGGVGKGDRQAEIIKLLLCTVQLNRKPTSLGVQGFDDLRSYLNSVLSEIRIELPEIEITNIQLDAASTSAAWEVLTSMGPELLNSSWAQDIFMRFGPKFLKRDLDQYFTPTEIVEFMSQSLDISGESRVIDPAGGSADFLTGAAISSKLSAPSTPQPVMHYWDQSDEAATVARLNLWINGVKADVSIKDSIEKCDDLNGNFDFCITNPPFGTKTIWDKPRPIEAIEGYELAWKVPSQGKKFVFRQQLGILFIERGLALLKPKGILSIVLPSGYLSNPSEEYLRAWLLDNHRVLGIISLPAGTFKKSGAGVSPDILLVQKGKVNEDYDIFMAKADQIGFDFKKQDTPKIFARDELTGEFKTSESGELISANDLSQIKKELADFARANRIPGLSKGRSERTPLTVKRSDVLKTDGRVLSPNRFDREYLEVRAKLIKQGAKSIAELGGLLATDRTFRKRDNESYVYLDIGEIGQCSYKMSNSLMGWRLPARAKQEVHKDDVLVSRLAGSSSKFCLISGDHENLVATNGLFIVRIPDKVNRLTFLSFLFSNDYRLQFEALATGSIMEDVKEQDFLNEILVSTKVSRDRLSQLETFCELQSAFISGTE